MGTFVTGMRRAGFYLLALSNSVADTMIIFQCARENGCQGRSSEKGTTEQRTTHFYHRPRPSQREIGAGMLERR
jgi:hypothetical protein